MYRATILWLSLFLFACGRRPEITFSRYIREGKEFVAKKDYPRALLQFKNASKCMPKDAEPYYQLGLIAIASGDMQAASEYLYRATLLNPKRPDAKIALSGLLIRSADPSAIDEGRRLAQQVLAMTSEDVEGLNLVALELS